MEESLQEELFELRTEGLCCSQIIMALGLKRLSKENPDLIRAMAGLCNGLWKDGECGIVSAGICLLFLADPQAAARGAAEEFNDWFEASYGSAVCGVLLENNPLNKGDRCPAMTEGAFRKLCEILEWEDTL